MTIEVIKKDGAKEPFDSQKIKNAVLAASAGTNLTDEVKEEVAAQVTIRVTNLAEAAGKDVISTSELRENILKELDEIESAVSEAWREYDTEKKAE